MKYKYTKASSSYSSSQRPVCIMNQSSKQAVVCDLIRQLTIKAHHVYMKLYKYGENK